MRDIELPEGVAFFAEYGGDVYTAAQVRAAVEADRAQRVQEGWKQEAAEAIDWLLNNIRRDAPQLSGKAMGNAVRVRDALLASTPAPAQQELERELGPRMSRACLDAWDKSDYTSGPQDAVHPMFLDAFSAGFKAAAQHQEPPHQERKPMTYREIADATSEWAHVRSDYTIGIIRAAERHHGIRE